MKPVNGVLTFCGYRVLNASFTINRKFDDVTSGFGFTPSFTQTINQIDEKKYALVLGVLIESEKDGKIMPFDAKVEMEGVFEVQSGEDHEALMRLNATSILFPYLRTALSSLTMLANISPVVLPTVNVAKMFSNASKEQPQEIE